MSEIKLSTSKMNAGETMDFATKLITLNAPDPPDPPPIPNMAAPVADLNAEFGTAKAANDLHEQTKAPLPGLLSARDGAIVELKGEVGLINALRR